jgi:hypothetical protein
MFKWKTRDHLRLNGFKIDNSTFKILSRNGFSIANWKNWKRFWVRLIISAPLVFKDRGSLDRISLDRISWSKVSNNLGVWSNYSINWLKRTDGFWQLIEILIMSFWVILNFRSSAKIRRFFFGSWSKVFKWI